MVHGACTITRHFLEIHTKCTIMVRYSFFALAWCILDLTQTVRGNCGHENFHWDGSDFAAAPWALLELAWNLL
jgi:hypothetical protein